MEPTHPDKLAENATALSAGGSQGPAGRSGWESGIRRGAGVGVGLSFGLDLGGAVGRIRCLRYLLSTTT